jgi:small subunit ribosomal protein S21
VVLITVRDNDVEKALRVLKKKMQREGLFREMRRREHYEPPSEKRKRKRAEAIRRSKKRARKAADKDASANPGLAKKVKITKGMRW